MRMRSRGRTVVYHSSSNNNNSRRRVDSFLLLCVALYQAHDVRVYGPYM